MPFAFKRYYFRITIFWMSILIWWFGMKNHFIYSHASHPFPFHTQSYSQHQSANAGSGKYYQRRLYQLKLFILIAINVSTLNYLINLQCVIIMQGGKFSRIDQCAKCNKRCLQQKHYTQIISLSKLMIIFCPY